MHRGFSEGLWMLLQMTSLPQMVKILHDKWWTQGRTASQTSGNSSHSHWKLTATLHWGWDAVLLGMEESICLTSLKTELLGEWGSLVYCTFGSLKALDISPLITGILWSWKSQLPMLVYILRLHWTWLNQWKGLGTDTWIVSRYGWGTYEGLELSNTDPGHIPKNH